MIANCPVDARFEVLGSPYSLLSVSLSASQNLYTRKGTLVGVSGNAENVSDIGSTGILLEVLTVSSGCFNIVSAGADQAGSPRNTIFVSTCEIPLAACFIEGADSR